MKKLALLLFILTIGLLPSQIEAQAVRNTFPDDGMISSTEVKVSTTPNFDYVFEPDYELKPLHEVDQFIQQSKHLPDIPSAKEFKENGVGLGEMDNMLLRKVEELMLYVIELKKENESQTEEIKNLKLKLN